MRAFSVETTIRAPIDVVFDAVSDHEQFLRGQGIQSCRVSKPGMEEKNGAGAVRSVVAQGGLVLTEEIQSFERPHRYTYRVSRTAWRDKWTVPVEHDGGSMELTEDSGQTRVVWRSRFRCALPFVGNVVERAVLRTSKRTLQRVLDSTKRRLERS